MGSVTTAMFIVYHVFFGTSYSSVPWVYSAEVNSLGWRTRGAAAATATNWIGGFAVVQFTKVGIDRLHWAFYLSKLCAISVCHIVCHLLTMWLKYLASSALASSP